MIFEPVLGMTPLVQVVRQQHRYAVLPFTELSCKNQVYVIS